MGINRKTFFSEIKHNKLFSTLKQSQVEGMDVILDEWELSGFTDLRWLAYMMATVKWECAHTMQPISEYGKGKGRPYGSKIKHSGVKYTTPDKIYYGRGLVQLSWYENYELMGRLLGMDLLNKPEMAMQTEYAVAIMFEGMTKGSSSFGDFTGKCLEMYFNNTTEDWIGARKIINGTDKAKEIADIAKKFYSALLKAKE